LELRQLRYFVALAEELHFGRAAAREHIGQSSLSQQLQRLERELDVVLLERTTHHVRLSPAGRCFCSMRGRSSHMWIGQRSPRNVRPLNCGVYGWGSWMPATTRCR